MKCNNSAGTILQWWSLETISRHVSRPIFASLGLEGFRSRDFEYCKEMVY